MHRDSQYRVLHQRRGSLVGALVAFLALPSLAGGQLAPHGNSSLKNGIVVEWVSKNSEGDHAGVRAGDILLSWKRGELRGELHSPFELSYLRIEQAPRGPVTLQGLRGQRKQSWVLQADVWGFAGRPYFRGELLTIYEQGNTFEQAGNINQAIESWRRGATLSESSNIAWLPSWFLAHAAQHLYRPGEREQANGFWKQAIDQSSEAGPIVRAELFREVAVELVSRYDDLASGKKYFENALAEWLKLGSDVLGASETLRVLGAMISQRGEIRESEQYFRRSLAIAEKAAPTSLEVPWVITELGKLAADQGDLALAEHYFRQGLALEQRYFPQSKYMAQVLGDLADFAEARGDFPTAGRYYRRALTIAKKLDPNSLTESNILSKLAECLLDQGNALTAEKYQERALSVRRSLDPNGLPAAVSLASLGKIAGVRGDRGQAEQYYRQALTITKRLNSPSYQVAEMLSGLAEITAQAGDFAKAEELYRRALAIIGKVAPGNVNQLAVTGDLAQVTRRLGRLDAAGDLYQQALHGFETEVTRLGGLEEDRSRYRADNTKYYKQYADLLMEQGKSEKAFEMTEASRARTLLEMLARANVDVHSGANDTVIMRERELRRRMNAAMQRRIRLMSAKHTDQNLFDLDRQIEDLRDDYDRVEAEIRSDSPQYSALTQPQPLSPSEMQQLLDPDTVLLEYSLGEERSFVWIVTDKTLTARELPKRVEVEKIARRLYQSLTARTQSSSSAKTGGANLASADALSEKLAGDLSQMILSPIADLIAGKRLLIVSDGALQYIPFSALPTPETSGVPLIVQHEIVNLPSASVLAEIRQASAGRQKPTREVAVLADPVFDAKDERVTGATSPATSPKAYLARTNQLATRSARDIGFTARGGFYLPRLFYTRDEARAILAVTPHREAREVLDFEANRAAAVSPELAHYRIIHFATHGFLDSKRPELSGLVLSLVTRHGQPQDGFLGLEDIYNMKLAADLVVLSGCQTGLGEEISGEGLIGLTRGFMYAGASRVVASLWSVDDFATSELMTHFYRAMERDKMPPAAALRSAQIAIWKHKGWHAPYYWAAFQIQGEWK